MEALLNSSLTGLNQSPAAPQALKITGDLVLTITARSFMSVSGREPLTRESRAQETGNDLSVPASCLQFERLERDDRGQELGGEYAAKALPEPPLHVLMFQLGIDFLAAFFLRWTYPPGSAASAPLRMFD